MLDREVQAHLDVVLPLRIDTHFLNLSRGVLVNDGRCGIPAKSHVFYSRIPSTWCEQKRWDDILRTLPPDMWISMAYGQPAIVHDRSEKTRPTRAVWQGLSWIRYAVNSAWDLPVQVEYSRSGMKLNPYWAKVFVQLPRSTRQLLRYYLNFYKDDGGSVKLYGCHTCEKGSANG